MTPENGRDKKTGGNTPALRILRFKEVCRRTGYSRSTIYLRIKEGTFPKPIPLGPRLVAWPEYEIVQWIEDQIEAGRQSINQ